MKKTCIFLLLIVWAIYIKEGYELLTADDPVKSVFTGTLSDVADEVIAIPLETNTNCQLEHATLIKRDQQDLFLVSNHQLYHFDCSGKFIKQITHNNQFPVADYTIDPINKQLLVMDNLSNIYYYDYLGVLQEVRNLAGIRSLKGSTHLSYYNHYIWITTQSLAPDREEPDRQIVEQWLYKFDSAFNPVEARKLTPVDLGRLYIEDCFSQEIGVANNNVYVHSASSQPAELLRDTLYLISQNKLNIHNEYASILPIRIGNRFLVSTHYNKTDIKQSYTFCFDHQERTSYNIKEGFEDNFYHTGKIPELQAMDIYNNTFCYCKSGEEVKKAFPDRKSNENPVLFIIKMKA